jgi:hypothetical protein
MHIKLYGKRNERPIPLERPTHRLENKIETDIKAVGLDSVIWVHLAQNRAQ